MCRITKAGKLSYEDDGVYSFCDMPILYYSTSYNCTTDWVTINAKIHHQSMFLGNFAAVRIFSRQRQWLRQLCQGCCEKIITDWLTVQEWL